MRERRFIPFTSISSTYTTIISNLVCNFLIKMHYHIGLFIYHFFNKYALRQLYHMCKTPENSNFLKNDKMVISIKIQNFLDL